MANTSHTKEYVTDEDVIAAIKERSVGIVPREASLRAAHAATDAPESIPSPYSTPWIQSFSFKKVSISLMLLLFVLVGGGAAYTSRKAAEPLPTTTPSAVATEAPADSSDTVAMLEPTPPSDISDQGIDQDVQALDAQMQGLDSDISATQTAAD